MLFLHLGLADFFSVSIPELNLLLLVLQLLDVKRSHRVTGGDIWLHSTAIKSVVDLDSLGLLNESNWRGFHSFMGRTFLLNSYDKRKHS